MPDLNPKPKTHYDQLGIKPTASPQQIRRAFRDLSKLYHPDTTALPAAEATEKFQQLNDAYAILSSPDRRWAYDQQVGYSRISVMQPLESLQHTPTTSQRREPANMYLDPTDRPLSAGEIFALFILGLTFVACLALVVTVSLTRGEYAAKPVGPDLGPNLETRLEQGLPEIEAPPTLQADDSEASSRSAPVLPANPDPPKPSAASPPTWL
ncbi:MAG: J domain-containing protein [Nodosilinea sp.]